MKKITLLTVLLLSLSAMSAFAAWTAKTYDPGTTDGTVTVGSTGAVDVKVSKGVSLAYDAETTGLGYSVGTYHSSGTKTFASSSGDSKIWFTDVTADTIPDAPAGTDSADFSGWTAL